MNRSSRFAPKADKYALCQLLEADCNNDKKTYSILEMDHWPDFSGHKKASQHGMQILAIGKCTFEEKINQFQCSSRVSVCVNTSIFFRPNKLFCVIFVGSLSSFLHNPNGKFVSSISKISVYIQTHQKHIYYVDNIFTNFE